MFDEVNVTIENMWDLISELRDYNSELEHFAKRIGSLTSELGSSIRGCNRMKDVTNVSEGIKRTVNSGAGETDNITRDLERRARGIEDFENGNVTGNSGAWDEI